MDEMNLQYRYPGSRPFSDNHIDRVLFFGRTKEKQLILHMVLSEKMVVLFAKSGMGKTSLINAGLLKPLREKNYLPIRISFTDPKIDPIHTIFSRIEEVSKIYYLDYKPGSKNSFWEYFKTSEFWSSDNILLTPILILDQVEELFTLHSKNDRKELVTQLADLVRDRNPKEVIDSLEKDTEYQITNKPPHIKIVISIREDFLAELDELSYEIPEILNNRFRLLALNSEQAKDAIIEPAKLVNDQLSTINFTYEENAVNAIINFLTTKIKKDLTVQTNDVEPFQLQLLCQHYEKLIQFRNQKLSDHLIIKEIDLDGIIGMEKVLKEFYINTINEIRPIYYRYKIFKLFEKKLISKDNRRLSIEENQILRKPKIKKEVLSKLVDSRLIRAEPRVGSVYYELSHDTLIQPIRYSQRERKKTISKGVFVTTIFLFILYFSYQPIVEQLEINREETLIHKFESTFIEKKKIEAQREKLVKTEVTQTDINPYKNLLFIYAKKNKFREGFDKCENAFKKGINIKNLWPDFFEVIKIARIDKKDKQEKISDIILEFLQFPSSDPKYYYNLAQELILISQDENAIIMLNKAVEKDNKYPEPHYLLGQIFYNKAEYPKAIPYFTKFLETTLFIDDRVSLANNYLGNIQFFQDNFFDAILHYKKSLSIMPNNSIILTNLCSNYLAIGQIDDAKNFCNSAFLYNKTSDNAYSIGDVFIEYEELELAEEFYIKGASLDEDRQHAFRKMGYFYHENMNNYEKAYEFYKDRYDLNKNDLEAKMELAESSLTVQKFTESLALSKEILMSNKIDTHPGKIPTEIIFITSALILGQREAGSQSIEKLIKYYKNNQIFAEGHLSEWKYDGIYNFINNTDEIEILDKYVLLSLIEIFEKKDDSNTKKLKDLESVMSIFIKK